MTEVFQKSAVYSKDTKKFMYTYMWVFQKCQMESKPLKYRAIKKKILFVTSACTMSLTRENLGIICMLYI